MSIVRVGLAETKGFSEGYDAIFGNKTQAKETSTKKKPTAKKKMTARKSKKK